MTQAQYSTQDGIAIITLANPPVNGLGHELRTGIVEALRQAEADPAVAAIVITGGGKAFSGGADIREFNTPKALAEPNLGTVIRTIEGASKPVVAAIHSVCMGGGLELALGCHYRVASPGAQIALPEVKLGLIPGAGGTQRLPRVVPLDMAVNIIVSGNPVPSEKFKGTQLFDAIYESDLTANAVAFARKVVADKRGMPKVRDRRVEFPDAEAFLRFARNTAQSVAPNFPAPVKCIDAIAGAVKLPFDQGVKEERRMFVELLQSPESRAMRHAFFGERAASKIPDVPSDTPLREIKSAAVIGAGTMGGGIAMNFANAGIPVTVVEMNEEALNKTLSTGEAHYWSRSRGELWHKGATSGQVQVIEELRVDCDQDAVWLKVWPQGDGGACHTGERSCFYRVVEGGKLVKRP